MQTGGMSFLKSWIGRNLTRNEICEVTYSIMQMETLHYKGIFHLS